jgi:hypothetical protein
MNIDTNDEIFHGDGKLIDVEIFVNANNELVKDNSHRQQIIMYYNIIIMEFFLKILLIMKVNLNGLQL